MENADSLDFGSALPRPGRSVALLVVYMACDDTVPDARPRDRRLGGGATKWRSLGLFVARLKAFCQPTSSEERLERHRRAPPAVASKPEIDKQALIAKCLAERDGRTAMRST
jgi:hypothetical protein